MNVKEILLHHSFQIFLNVVAAKENEKSKNISLKLDHGNGSVIQPKRPFVKKGCERPPPPLGVGGVMENKILSEIGINSENQFSTSNGLAVP